MNRRWLPAALAALVVAGCGVDERGRSAAQEGNASVAQEGNASVQSARERFSALRSDGAPPSALSDRAARDVSMVTRGKPFSVHTVAVQPGYEFYVLETADGLCTYETSVGEGAGGGCTPNMEAFARGGLNYTLGDPYRLTALLPDGATDVTLIYADGTKEKLGVARNHGTKVVKTLPVRAAWTLPDGSVESRTMSDPGDVPAAEPDQGAKQAQPPDSP